MFLPELYFGCQNNNSLEASPSFVEKHDCSQSKYPGRIGKTCEGERSSFYYCVPSSNCVCQPQHAIIDDSVIYEGDSCPATAYAHHLNAVNVISNSFPIHHDHDQNSSEMNENNSLEISPAECIRKQSEPCAFNLHEGGNIQDSIEEKSYSFNAVNNKGKRKPRVDAETAARRKAHIDFQVKRTTRSQISGALGSMDRHSKVLTSKGPRDRRIRLAVGTAIKLYCLQESLGFDQPSKAVEWLIKNSQASIRELPQVSSISCSDISPHVDSDRSTAVCVSCHQTGELSTLSQDNTCSTASRDCVVNPHDQILAANSCLCQKSSTATTIESNNRGSMVQGEKREQRTMVMSSVSSRITRSTANDVRRRKEFRAKARERARERTKKKEKRYNQDCGIYGLLRPSSVPPQFSAFSLQDNSTSASSLNMINETTGAYSNRFGFRHSFMSPKPFHLCSTCISSPPTQIQSSLASVHYSSTQQEDISIQSTGALSSSDPEVIPVTSDSFPQAVATANNCSSHCVFCSYPPDHAHLNSSNLYGSCREESIEMTGTYDSGLDTPFQRQSTRKKETFQELHANEEIPCLKSPNEYVPFGSIMSNPYSYHGIFGLLQ